MFSLIISIIAIALVIVLAGASLYYGGDAFNKGTAKGEAAKYVNEAQQLQAAVTMYKVDNKGDVSSVSSTVLKDDGYLSADLSHWTVTGVDAKTADGTVSTEVCEIIQDDVNGIRASNSQISCTAGAVTYTF
jgi:hypothetical protein